MASGKEDTVAERTFFITALEKQWLLLACALQRAALKRKAAAERPGSEIAELRQRELDQFDAVIAKLERV